MDPSQLPLSNSSSQQVNSAHTTSPFLPSNPVNPFSPSKWLLCTTSWAARSDPTTYARHPTRSSTSARPVIDKDHQQLALGILTSLFAGIGYASSGGAKKVTGSTPPINASSKDEADFIQYVANPISERARKIGHSGRRRPDALQSYKS